MSVLPLEPIESDASFRRRAYEALRVAILATNIYETPPEALRLDERRLAAKLGVSRTPIREALARLEHEGLVQNLPRRGYFIVRKNRAELVEIITVWAALESMAARLITTNATSDEITSLRTIFATFDRRPSGGQPRRVLRRQSAIPSTHPRAFALRTARANGRRHFDPRPFDPSPFDR